MSQIAAGGLPLRYIENERIALDIDEPKDLERLLSFNHDAAESTRVARAMMAQHDAEHTRRSGGL
jgi:2-phospho-L-lactate guanylyltransferase (CobY/MobA/RfbA family)